MPIDYSKYPPDWKTVIRPARRGGVSVTIYEKRCVECGIVFCDDVAYLCPACSDAESERIWIESYCPDCGFKTSLCTCEIDLLPCPDGCGEVNAFCQCSNESNYASRRGT